MNMRKQEEILDLSWLVYDSYTKSLKQRKFSQMQEWISFIVIIVEWLTLQYKYLVTELSNHGHKLKLLTSCKARDS